jgi:putative ABC transport system substrate-binding protein
MFKEAALSVSRVAILWNGPNTIEMNRSTATYVDKILRGERPADVPMQQPSRYEFVISLKAAKRLGLTVPPTLLARADEVHRIVDRAR